jgi:hypothetical protein
MQSDSCRFYRKTKHSGLEANNQAARLGGEPVPAVIDVP